MNSFKAMIAEDNARIFLNLDEFAESHIIVYDGVTYDGEDGNGIPVVLTKVRESERAVQTLADHAQGLYRVTEVLHFDSRSLDGKVPEQGTKIKISEGKFLREFYVASSAVDMGMAKVELEALDE